MGITPAGVIEGMYLDPNNVYRGFLRDEYGTITTFDVPAAGAASDRGTTPASNNESNAIAGWYTDASGLYHGFLRTE